MSSENIWPRLERCFEPLEGRGDGLWSGKQVEVGDMATQPIVHRTMPTVKTFHCWLRISDLKGGIYLGILTELAGSLEPSH